MAAATVSGTDRQITKCAQSQYVEAGQALYGQGDYQPSPSAACYQVIHEYRSTTSTKQRENLASTCFRLQPIVPSMMSTAETLQYP